MLKCSPRKAANPRLVLCSGQGGEALWWWQQEGLCGAAAQQAPVREERRRELSDVLRMPTGIHTNTTGLRVLMMLARVFVCTHAWA